ncbi:hypothetical protein PHLGIDRAFT_117669 [Phlebiopsis gigantea 11061_1 CR5-6]|uniref:Uncharacterized protein n=1 Tax=Phlebiopsis gigantea (strain 11061_1 CR5-6) TaxID=745531 RepID=A0A0C3RZP4_PHLG1|nr:hypothetical protein PHLGIDRAFT_117669 [Phlebiopsis gigantea 11061_1 CR5-6]
MAPEHPRRADDRDDVGGGRACANDRAAPLRLRALPRDALDAALRDIAADVPTRVYADLLELHRGEFYCAEIRGRAWDLILAEMSRERTQGLIRVLRAWSLADLVAFFTLVSAAEKDTWDKCPATLLPRRWGGFPTDKTMLDCHAGTSFFYMLVAVLSDLRDVLDQSQVLRVLALYPTLRPVALLFRNGTEKADLDGFFAYVRASYADPLNLPDALSSFVAVHTPERAAAVFFDRSAPALVSAVVDRLLGEIGPHRTDRRQRPDGDAAAAAAHPASPFLCFAVHLAYESRTAARMLLERGLARRIEHLYDMYDDARALPDAWTDGVHTHGRLTMLHLCHFLLLAVARHCDLSVYVVKEELSAHVRERSRELSERWFGCLWGD